jgi:hypothetical protein
LDWAANVSLLLTSFARQGVRAGAAPPPFVSLPAVYRQWGTPIDTTARFTIPLAPNHGYTTADVRVFYDGVEQAIHIEELRGRHNNGSGGDGGARAFFVECNASSFTDNTACEIRLGDGARVPSDLSASGRGSMAMVRGAFENPRVILTTDADYLCTTWATFHPLVPDADVHADDVAWAVTGRNTIIGNYGVAGWPVNPAVTNTDGSGNWYDGGWTAFGWYCQTGNTDRWNQARGWCNFRLTYDSPPASGPSAATVHLNPEGIGGSLSWQPGEIWSLTHREKATAYLLTGYGQFWRNLNTQTSQTVQSNNWTQAGTSHVIGTGGGRFNMGRNVTPAIYGALIDATWVMPTGDYAGGNARRTATWATDLEKIMDAYDDAVYDTTRGAYRDGFRGYRMTTDATGDPGNRPASIGDYEQFQGAAPTIALIDYYLNIKADNRIPGWVRTNVGVAMQNMVDGGGAAWGAPYLSTWYAGFHRGAVESPWLGGDYYRVSDTGSAIAQAATSNTVTLSTSASVATDSIAGDFIFVYGTTSGGAASVERHEISTYNSTTKVATLSTSFSVTPTGTIVYTVSSLDAAKQSLADRATFGSIADWMRAVQFVAALYPSDTINGKTYAEWLTIFRARHAAVMPFSGVVNSGSLLGRWMNTMGTYFQAVGVPTGPSAIREPVVHTGA